MKILGITGSIASGKSTFSKLLSEIYNIPLIDADDLVKKLHSRKDVILKIKETFGSEFLTVDEFIDNKKLGEFLFGKEEELKKLNDIIHPLVKEEYSLLVEKYKKEGYALILYDCPLLIEADLINDVDKILLVYVDKKTQLSRLIKRNLLSEEEALKRISSQLSMDEKLSYADIVVYNNGSLKDLEESLDNIYKKILEELKIEPLQ